MDKDYLIKKWLANKLTENELAEFKKLDDYNFYTKIIEGAKNFDTPQFSEDESLNELKPKLKSQKVINNKFNSYKFLIRVAALLVISLGIYWGFFSNNMTTIETFANQKTSFELPDASSVSLNADSKVGYNKNKWSRKRVVHLNGEAFFKVAKGSKFDVITDGGIVSVLGTKFDVKSRNSYFEVQCYEGVVSVANNGNLYKLIKGHVYRLINGVEQLDTVSDKQPNWLDNNSSFKSVPLHMVIDELERQYGIEITVKDVDTNRLFTGEFMHNNLEQALISISVPFNLHYSKNGSNKITLYSIEK